MPTEIKKLFEFGPFRLDTVEGVCDRSGTPVYLKPKELAVLLVFLQKPGQLISKDDILAQVWPDAFVEEANISRHIGKLRKKLGLDIQNVPRKGYRLNMEVKQLEVADPNTVVHERTTSTIIIEEVETDHGNERTSGNESPQARISSRLTTAWTVVATLLLVAITALGLYYFWPAAVASPSSLVILPFRSLNVESGDDALQLGMTDALITRLSNIRKVKVRPTSSVIKYLNKDVDPAVVGREMGVDLILLGSIQKSESRFRVTVQLIRAKDSSTTWAAEVDEHSSDFLKVQDIIAEKLARALALSLSGDEQKRLTLHPTSNPEAYELYLQGRYAWRKRTEDRFYKAINYFEQAIAIDPAFALAYVGLADTYSLQGAAGYGGVPAQEVVKKARAAVSSALEIDERLAEAHASLGYIRWFYDWDWAGAEKEYRRAIELDPDCASAHQWYALCLATRGELGEALEEMQTARSLDPTSEIINTNLGAIFYYMRRYDDAIQQYQATLELDPAFSATHLNLGMAYDLKGMHAEALAEYEKAASATDNPLLDALTGRALAATGKQKEARKVLESLTASSKGKAGWGYFIALVHTGLNQKDQALEWLTRACAERSGHLTDIKVDPMLDGLRSDVRFQGLLHCLGLD